MAESDVLAAICGFVTGVLVIAAIWRWSIPPPPPPKPTGPLPATAYLSAFWEPSPFPASTVARRRPSRSKAKSKRRR